jgi:hypothetical protein
MQKWFAEITKEDVTVRLGGDGSNGIDVRTIKGWWSTPDSKVSMTARESGDGSHDVEGRSVLYASRTVTIECVAHGRNRTEVERQIESLLWMAHGLVRLRVVDEDSDTCVEGFVTVEVKAGKATRNEEDVTVTVRCPRPERLSTNVSAGFMKPSSQGFGGLVYDSGVLRYPLQYGDGAEEMRSVCTVSNKGTSEAYPVIYASGDMPNGFAITNQATGEQLVYSQPVGWSVVEIDCRSRTASVNGVDVTRNVTQRGFPTVPAGGSITLSLSADGIGTIEVDSRDTYI